MLFKHYILTAIELYIIQKVKQMRKERKISQLELAQKMNLSDTFIGHVESNKKKAKYNINHLNEIAKILDCSLKDFFPEEPL